MRKDLRDWGLTDEAIEEWLQATRGPDFLPPDLDRENLKVFAAFFDLSPSRRIGGFGVGGIPGSEIFLHADRFGFRDDELFFRLIRAMDNAYIDHVARKQATK